MNGLLQALLSNGGSSQLLDMALNWAFSQPMANSICKSLNWDVVNAKQTIVAIIDHATKSYQARVPFSKTIEQRMSDTTQIYQELVGYNTITEFERRLLASRLAGFNAKEIQIGLALQEKYSVEQISDIINEAQNKYLEASKNAGVSAVGGNIEQSSNVNLQDVFSKISSDKKSSGTPEN